MNNEEFIKKAKLKHSDRYDYSLVEYINSRTKVTIICKEHGEYKVIPSNHLLLGQNCLLCVNNNIKYTKEKFIEKSNKIHNFKYDYSLVNYKNNKTRVRIICPLHGEFEQIAGTHLQGKECKKCGNEKTSKKISGVNHKKYILDRKQEEINRKIKYLSRHLIRATLKSSGIIKNEKTFNLLKYNNKQLLEHLQRDPNYDNWINDTKNYHIDHILPIVAFTRNNILDPSIINNFKNLRIIPAKENMSKCDKYDKKDLEKYLEDFVGVYK